MKFEKGDEVVYYKKEKGRPNPMLTLFGIYIIDDILCHENGKIEHFNKQNFFLSLRDKYNKKYYWYDYRDFISIKGYRQLKLNKLKNGSS